MGLLWVFGLKHIQIYKEKSSMTEIYISTPVLIPIKLYDSRKTELDYLQQTANIGYKKQDVRGIIKRLLYPSPIQIIRKWLYSFSSFHLSGRQ